MLPDTKSDDCDRTGSRGVTRGGDSKDDGGEANSRYAADSKSSPNDVGSNNREKVRKIHNSSSPNSSSHELRK